MKNYLARLGLPRKATQADIVDAIADEKEHALDTQSLHDAESILTDKVMKAYYERVHLQYEAIAESVECLQTRGAVDTHRWVDRTAEFEPVSDDEQLS